MSDFREEEALGKPTTRSSCGRLITYLRPYKRSVVSAVVLTLLVGPLEVVGPYLFGYGVDKYIVPGTNHSIPIADALHRHISVVFARISGRVAVQFCRASISRSASCRTSASRPFTICARKSSTRDAAPADEFL